MLFRSRALGSGGVNRQRGDDQAADACRQKVVLEVTAHIPLQFRAGIDLDDLRSRGMADAPTQWR